MLLLFYTCYCCFTRVTAVLYMLLLFYTCYCRFTRVTAVLYMLLPSDEMCLFRKYAGCSERIGQRRLCKKYSYNKTNQMH